MVNFVVDIDRTGSISDETLREIHKEVIGIMKGRKVQPGDADSYPMFPQKKTFSIPLDFTDNISHADMARFMDEISEINGDTK